MTRFRPVQILDSPELVDPNQGVLILPVQNVCAPKPAVQRLYVQALDAW